MRVCHCILAGTRACDSCTNGPSRSWSIKTYSEYKKEKKKDDKNE